MRLTLRTLLAYLDDTLSPQETREIGQKVQESEHAQELVKQIKAVTRRRRLTTPEMTGHNEHPVDANTVAEYLENVLPPEKLAELERICLESDVHLAEVAACHQILTVILGEPAKVPPTARQRMYSLVEGPEADPTRRVRLSAAAEEAANLHDETDEALLLGLPPYQSHVPWGRRLIPVAAAAVLVAGLVLVLSIMLSRAPLRPELASSPPAPGKEPVAATIPGKPPAVADGPESPATSPEIPVGDWKWWAGWVAPTGSDKQPPTASLGSAPMWASWLAVRPGMPVPLFLAYTPGDAPPVEPTPPTPPVPPSTAKVIPPPSPARTPVGLYTAASAKDAVPGLLLRQTGMNEWLLVRPETVIQTGEPLLCLPGYRCEIACKNGLQLSLIGSLPVTPLTYVYETAVTLHQSKDAELDLTLDRGRFLIVNQPDQPSRVRLRFLDQVWDIRLLQPNSRIGVELAGRVPQGTGRWAPHMKLTLVTTGGGIELTIGDRTEAIPPGQMILWDLKSHERSLRPFKTPVADVPAWMRDKASYDNDVRAALSAFADSLSQKPSDEKGAWVLIAFQESLEEPQRWQRWLGLFSLGAVDQLPLVVKALDELERHDMRFAAGDTLRHWLSRRPDQNAALLPMLLERGFSDPDAELLMQLLRGHDQTSVAIVKQLLGQLRHPRLIIRELSLINLNFMVPSEKLAGYNPLATPEQRDRAIDIIENRLIPK